MYLISCDSAETATRSNNGNTRLAIIATSLNYNCWLKESQYGHAPNASLFFVVINWRIHEASTHGFPRVPVLGRHGATDEVSGVRGSAGDARGPGEEYGRGF